MKKIIFIWGAALILLGCSEENIITEETVNLKTTAPASDAPSVELRGVFTTLNSKYRATVQIEFGSDELATAEFQERKLQATLSLHTGETFKAISEITVDPSIVMEDIVFSSNDWSFTLNAEAWGVNPRAESVLFKGLEGDIILAKHTQQAPVSSLTGTYSCTDCGSSPYLDAGAEQSFNLMFSTPDGVGSITTQSVFGSTTTPGIGFQDNCSATGVISTCDINSGDGSSTTVGFLSNGNPVYWTGFHVFNNEPSSAGNDCSGIYGTWSWESNSYGTLTGRFQSDNNCFVELYSEDFTDFDGSGFDPNPAVGQLDSDIIITSGWSDGSVIYGGSATTGDFARGSDTNGGVSQGGIYAFTFTDLASGPGLGVQPTGSDFTPGYFEFRITNGSPNNVNTIRVNYDIFAWNDQNRSNQLNLSYSTDGTNFTPVSDVDFASAEMSMFSGSPPPPPELPVFEHKYAILNITVPAGTFLYLRFTGDDLSGTGSRDEFVIDNIVVEGI